MYNSLLSIFLSLSIYSNNLLNSSFRYACGRWPLEHPIPDSSFTNSWLREGNTRVTRKIRDLLKANMSANKVPWAVKQAKTLYTSCIDVRTLPFAL